MKNKFKTILKNEIAELNLTGRPNNKIMEIDLRSDSEYRAKEEMETVKGQAREED